MLQDQLDSLFGFGNYRIIGPSVSVSEAVSGLPDQVRNISLHTPTNSSVQTPSGAPLGKSRVILDWLQFHLDNRPECWAALHRWFPDFKQAEECHVPGFTHSAVILDKGAVAWREDKLDKKILVRLPAQALALLERPVLSLMTDVLFLGGDFSRLDFAIDSFDGLLDMKRIEQKLDLHEVVTRWRKFRPETGDRDIGGNGQVHGYTIYVGRRVSESFLRIYDKGLEQKAKLQDEVEESSSSLEQIRVELESKKRKAQALGEAVVTAFQNGDNPALIIIQHLRSLIDFKEPGADSHRHRWLTSDWWLDFLEGAAKVAVQLPEPEVSIEKLKNWIQHIAPALAVMLSVDVDWLLEAIAGGTVRFRRKHKYLLSRAGVPLPEVIDEPDEEQV